MILKRQRKHPWTLTHSHYVVMGGFAVDTSSLDENYLPCKRTRLTLTAAGVLHLASHFPEMLPDVSVDYIRDKSKASGIAKSLVCLQALWFCVTTIGRLSFHYPISALELNTLAHALCCLFTYLLWWNKPFDIDLPTFVLQHEAGQEVAAAMCMLSTVGMFQELAHYPRGSAALEYHGRQTFVADDEVRLNIQDQNIRMKEDETVLCVDSETQQSPASSLSSDIEVSPSKTSNDSLSIPEKSQNELHPPVTHQHESIHSFSFRYIFGDIVIHTIPGLLIFNKKWPRRLCHARETSQLTLGTQIRLDAASQRRLQLASRAFASNPSWPTLSFAKFGSPSKVYRKATRHTLQLPEYLIPHATDVLTDSSIGGQLGFILAGSLYGGIHLLAWNGPFSSHAELILWRIACCVIVAPIVLAPVLISSHFNLSTRLKAYIAKKTSPRLLIPRLWSSALDHPWSSASKQQQQDGTGYEEPGLLARTLEWLVYLLVSVLLTVGGAGILAFAAAYALLRVYLVADCVWNLVHLRGRVFEVPQWATWPVHIGGS